MVLLVIIGIIAIAFVLVLATQKNSKKEESQSTSPVTFEPIKLETSDDEVIANANKMLAMMELLKQAKAHGDEKTVKEIQEMTYKGPLPEKEKDGSYTQMYRNYLRFKIAGINYREGISDYEGKFIGELVPEPSNQHDPNAIKIIHKDGKHLGYVPAEETEQLRKWVNNKFPYKCYGEITQSEDFDEEEKYYWGEVLVEEPK